MPEQQPKFYVTTPIYYVNARPHIGSAYTTIVADVLARRHRLLGDDTYFLTGTDEHGQKIERSAAAADIPPQEFTDEVSAQFRALWDRMGLTYDQFIRTTSEAHKRGAQQLFSELYRRGFIYLSTYTGSYCVSDEAFVDQPAGTPCPDCGRLLETVTEENFFFKLSAFQERILHLIESDELRITPESVRNEVLSFVRGGLKDLSVSRSSFTWGIPVPDEVQREAGATQSHVMYVWLDALTNYITAIGYGNPSAEAQAMFARYWPADLHLVGKEITRFHCVYWPAFLLAAELATPKQVTGHGWLLFDNAKMSKSKGNIVRAETILDAFGTLCPQLADMKGTGFSPSLQQPEHPSASAAEGMLAEPIKHERDLFAADVLRYYLIREIPFGQDGSFTFDALVTRYNADLANGYGNLVSRTLNLIAQSSKGLVEDCLEANSLVFYQAPRLETPGQPERPEVLGATEGQTLGWQILRLGEAFGSFLDRDAPTEALAAIARAITAVDGFITARKPWAATDTELSQEGRRSTLYAAAECIRIITALLYPILPFATARVWAQLGLGDIETATRNGELNNLQWGGLKPGTRLGPLAPIFPRAPKELAQTMADIEEARTTPTRTSATHPLAPEQQAGGHNSSPQAVEASTTDPAAPPRTTALAEPTLTVGGSTAEKPNLPTTPGPHTTAPASGPFATDSAQPSFINIDDFTKVELRVAQILVAERIPKADKLLRLEVDLGTEKRQILSGIAEWYTPEELLGRRIVVVANLAPRKMRGLESHGMLLAASQDQEGKPGKPILATFGEEIALGSRVR